MEFICASVGASYLLGPSEVTLILYITFKLLNFQIFKLT